MAAKRRTTIESKQTRSTIGEPDDQRRYRWEDETFEDAHAAFTRWADHVRDRPDVEDRRKRNLLYASMYCNSPILGFGTNSYTRSVAHQGRISLNATQNACDSLTSKICKNRPRPMFTTVDCQDYDLREKAENADLYVDGKFMEMGYYHTIFPGKVLDCNIYGIGITKVHAVKGLDGTTDAVVERRFPWEMIVDNRECMYGVPSRMGERRYYDKQTIWDIWKRGGKGEENKKWDKELDEILSSRAVDQDRDDFDRDENSEQAVVFEGYSRVSQKMIICLRGKTLQYAAYNDFAIPSLALRTDHFGPYNFLRPEVPQAGFYGIGVPERVGGIQAEINRLVRDIQMAMHLIAKPHWMVETSSNVNTASLNNDIATIIKYTGAVPPTVYTPQSMSAEVFQHLQYLVRTLYEITGISQLSAQSQKPPGLNAAVAMRTYLNVETERFGNLLRNSEESAALDAYKYARVLGGIEKPRKVMAHSGFKGRMRPQVTWDKLDFDTIWVQVYPTSKLPDTPAGKREYALELAQYTQVTTDDIFEMLEWDDTEAFARRRLAGKRVVERDITRIRRGDTVIRDPIGNHKMAYLMMLDAYEEARLDGLPEKRLAVFRNYVKACYRFMTGKEWKQQGPNPLPDEAPPPPPMGGPAPMLPPGAPSPPMGPLPNGGAPPVAA